MRWFKNRSKSSSEHPLANEAGLAQIFEALPRHAPLAAVRELSDWLGEIDSLEGVLDAPALAQAALRLDEGARAFAPAVWEQMLSEAAADGVHEEAWLVLSNCAQHAARAHRVALRGVLSDAAPDLRQKQLWALLCVRGLGALMRHKLLFRMRYRAPAPGFWHKALALTEVARKRDLAGWEVPAYDDDTRITPMSQFASGLLLDVSAVENLAPEQIATVGRIIERHQRLIVLRAVPGTTVPYYMDTHGDAGPLRLAPAEAAPDCLYFGPGRLPAEILAQQRAFGQKPAVPDWLVSCGCSPDAYLAVLNHLASHWSSEAPKRRYPRRRTEGEMLVVQGFGQVRRMVSASAFARSGRKIEYKAWVESMLRYADRFGKVNQPEIQAEAEARVDPFETLRSLELAGDKEMMERWRILDISDQGFGAAIPQHKRWLRANALIGFRLEQSLNWRPGIVRRIGRTADGRRQVGVEVLGGAPACAQYRVLDRESKGPWNHTPEFMADPVKDAILVSRITRLLIVDKDVFAPGRPIELLLEGAGFYARLQRLLARGRDFELLEYEEIPVPPAAGA